MINQIKKLWKINVMALNAIKKTNFIYNNSKICPKIKIILSNNKIVQKIFKIKKTLLVKNSLRKKKIKIIIIFI